ncbi:phospholipase-like protein [Tanacetum coccineum]
MRQGWFMASVEFIKGLADQDGNIFEDNLGGGNFFQSDEAGGNFVEHHNGFGGYTEDGIFVERLDETIGEKSIQVSIEEGDDVLDSEGDAEFFTEFNALKNQVALIKKRKANEFDDLTNRFSKLESSQAFLMFKRILQNDVCTKKEETNFNPKQSEEIPNFCSDHKDTSNHTSGVYTDPMPASSSSHLGKDDEVACHADDRMETDAERGKDDYTNSQHHLYLLIKACTNITDIPTIDVVVPPKMMVDHFTDDYMLMLNDEEKPVKSSLADMELEQQPNNLVKADDKPDDAPVKVKKKKCQSALRPDYVLRSIERRKKKLGMALKPPHGQQSATILAPRKIRSKSMNMDVITPPIFLEDMFGHPRTWSINLLMTHEPFIEAPDDCKRDKVTVLDYMSAFIKNKALPEYQFPWGKRDIFVGCRFWLTLSCLDIGKTGWLTDHVYFLVNEPKNHWCLAELEIRNRFGTFYDSLGWASGNRRQWWRKMKRYFPEKVTLYLHMYGVLESKGISADSYNITYNYADAPFQAALFGDSLAYHERMLEYFWSHKIEIESIVSIVEVRYVKKKFKVGDNNQIYLFYNIGSNSINITDDDGIIYFLKEVLESGDVVKNIFIKSFQQTLEVTRSSSSKPLDIDLNIHLFDEQVTHEWKEKKLNCMPTTPHAPTLYLKSPTKHNHDVEFDEEHRFDDKEACIYEIGLKCLREKDVTRVYRPKDIIHDLKMELNIYVSYKRAWKGKHLASDSNHGCPVASFAQLPFYCYNLKMANENIVTHIETDDEGHFKMLFIGFGVAVSIYYIF